MANTRKNPGFTGVLLILRNKGFEPLCPEAQEPKSCVSANSTNSAHFGLGCFLSNRASGIRTLECSSQSAVPYRLAMALICFCRLLLRHRSSLDNCSARRSPFAIRSPLALFLLMFLPSAPQTISADGRVTIQHPAKPIRNPVTSFPTCSCLAVCSSDTGLHSITAQHGKAHSQSVRLWLSSCSCFCRLLLSPILAPNRKKCKHFSCLYQVWC